MTNRAYLKSVVSVFYFEGGHPIFAKACQRKGLPYPKIDEQGQIVASDEWWQQMQMTQEAWQELDN